MLNFLDVIGNIWNFMKQYIIQTVYRFLLPFNAFKGIQTLSRLVPSKRVVSVPISIFNLYSAGSSVSIHFPSEKQSRKLRVVPQKQVILYFKFDIQCSAIRITWIIL